jgi:ribosome maturation factor RimP
LRNIEVQEFIAKMIEPFLLQEGFELVEVEYAAEGGNRYLRIYVDKEGGIDIDECGRISEHVSEQLDRSDPIPEAYILEISSPGAERPLRNERDYQRAVGKDVHILTHIPIAGKQELEGLLISCNESLLQVKVGKKEIITVIPREQITQARLAIRLHKGQ